MRDRSLAEEFDAARERAERLARMLRDSGHYPLLGGGDVNLYSLFVERAMTLVKPQGMIGLLTPSGIYADKTAAAFFQAISTRRSCRRVVRLREPTNRSRGASFLPGRRFPLQILRPDIRRGETTVR